MEIRVKNKIKKYQVYKQRIKSSKKYIYTLIILISLSLLIACEEEKVTKELPEAITIGVSITSMDEYVFKVMKEAMYDSRERDNVNIIWLNANNEEEKQKEDIDTLIEEGVDIIIINPVGSKEATELVKKINQANIPVLALDRLVENADLKGYITADSFEVGMEQARYIVDQIDQKGKILILKGDRENNVAYEISAGNKSILKNYINIRIVTEKWHKNWSAELAEKTVREALDRHPDIKGILANNSTMAMAAVKVLKEKDLIDDVVTVGADANEEASIAIAKGDHNADVDKMPYILGLSGFKAAQMIVRKETWHYEMRLKSGEYIIPVKVTPIKLIKKHNIILMRDRWPEINKYIN